MTAKEFYENQLHDKTTVVGRLEKDEIIELMQAYHEAKMQEITDDDIEAWANRDRKKLIDDEVWTTAELKERIWGRVEGARALREGKIKHTNPR